MSTFKRSSIDPKLVQEKFIAGELLTRAHFSKIKADKNKININVDSFLEEIGGITQTSSNDKQSGNRSASTSLLVPGLDLGLFHDIGFLHDVDQCTVRAYMYVDSSTTVKKHGGEFYNIKNDKKRFVPVIDRIEFIEKYKKYYSQHGNESTHYNEVLANIFPESLLGMVLSPKDTSNLVESKFRLLAANAKIKAQHQIALPMFLYNEGHLVEFNPSKNEVLSIVDGVFNQEKSKLNPDEKILKNVYIDMLSQLGYELSNPNLNLDQIEAKHLWKKELDIAAYEEFNTLCDSAIKFLLTELKNLDPKEKQQSMEIIKPTIEQIEILKKIKIGSNAELRTLYGKMNDIITSAAKENNIFKKVWNAIYLKIAELFKLPSKQLFETSTKKVLNLYIKHLKDSRREKVDNELNPPVKPTRKGP